MWVAETDGSHPGKHLTKLLQVRRQHNFELTLDKLQFKTNKEVALGPPLHLIVMSQKVIKYKSSTKCYSDQCGRPAKPFGYGELLKYVLSKIGRTE